MSRPLIETSRLAVRYPNGTVALDDVNLSVAAGEVVVILGANGSGKSSLLRCIAGMLHPATGTVWVAGTEIDKLTGRALSEARMSLGMIFQSACLVRRRSVLANVMTGTLGRHRNWTTALGLLPRSEQSLASAA